MVDKSKKRKKRSITEEDGSTLLQRYSVNTILALLQEVAQVAAGDKIDWHELVRKTATGISGAREYQMLWRHLAYGSTLIGQLDTTPMDDDSDLEYEVEAFPSVGREASIEAAACVKVIASGYPSDSHPANNPTIEAPFTINVPNSKAVPALSDSSIPANAMQGTNISIPVYVPKLPLNSAICGEKRPNSGESGVKRSKKAWSTEEDMKLTAAVQKYGEKKWANIARGDFQNDRKASELSQRWGNLKKKQGNLKVGTSSQPSETQLAAAHRAMNLALDMPMGDNLKARQINAGGIKFQHQPQKPSAPPSNQQLGRAGPSNPQVPTQRPLMNPLTPSPDAMVKAAAVAAGARIANSADASSLMEAARSQNVVHITTKDSSVMKPSTKTITNQLLPSNVHFIRNGLAKAPISTYSAPKPTISRPAEARQAKGQPITPSVQPNRVATAQVNPASTPSVEFPKTGVSTSVNETKELVRRDEQTDQVEGAPQDQLVALGNQSDEVQTSASGKVVKENTQGVQASISMSDPIGQATDVRVDLPCSEVGEIGKENSDNQSPGKKSAGIPVQTGGVNNVDGSEKSK